MVPFMNKSVCVLNKRLQIKTPQIKCCNKFAHGWKAVFPTLGLHGDVNGEGRAESHARLDHQQEKTCTRSVVHPEEGKGYKSVVTLTSQRKPWLTPHWLCSPFEVH